ncbi:MAG TPA: helix-turn-helix transcriptional regulator [Polyangiaceae bacterium]|nr:helix-turn-helix transcriptional regulator [Polyangiaceae bacterium]
MPTARHDELSVIEAAYILAGTESEWVESLARAAAPMLDEGWGLSATTWTAHPDGIVLRAMSTLGGPAALADAAVDAMRATRREIQLALVRSGPCTSLGSLGGSRLIEDDRGSQGLLRLGIRDSLTILAGDSGGFMTGLSAYRATPFRPSRRTVSCWSRIASHLAAGFRVRRGLAAAGAEVAAAGDPLVGCEAILTPSGKVAHAEEPAQRARAALARAVIAVDRARSSQRRDDPDGALEAWRGLVEGRWSLLEHFDTDGQRFLVARKNDPDAAGPLALSLRERQVLACRARGLSLKLIAYDLGLSVPSISRTLKSAMTKLGISSPEELAAFIFAGA